VSTISAHMANFQRLGGLILDHEFTIHALAKTKIQNIGSSLQPSDIAVDSNTVEQVDNFIYLDSAQSADGGSQADIKWRIALASSLISSLRRI